MKCSICKQGETSPGKATVTLTREETTVICKGVPAEICTTCGEYYLDETTSERVMKIAEDAVNKGTEVEIVRFAA